MSTVEEHHSPIVVRDDHHCFGCGRLNPYGLRLRFFREERGVLAPFTPEQRHEGYTGVVHGGIVTTIVDEVMAWALYAEGIWAVTGDLNVRFRRPMVVGREFEAHGRMERDRGRVLDVAGDVRRVGDGVVLATATATFVRVPEDQADAWRERYLAIGPSEPH